jgi:hypothetical protein
MFEFLRNTQLNERNLFAAVASPFHQNEFGGTLGGSIRKNKLFFGSYEAFRQSGTPGVSTITVLSERERHGDFNTLPVRLLILRPGRRFRQPGLPGDSVRSKYRF